MTRHFPALLIVGAITLSGCGDGSQQQGGTPSAQIEGTVRADGSSTVFPISEAVAEEFRQHQPKVRVTVGLSGTGGGFKKFDIGETDINNASRPITPKEIETARSNKIEFIELPVAFDGLSVLVNPKNDFVDHLTVAELKNIWKPDSTVKKWSDVRAAWPDNEIRLYGPGHDSGTFDYFTEAIVGEARSCRGDFTASEDDNTLVQGISGDVNALGYFGFAYYEENQEKLKLVPIDNGNGPVAPSPETINNGKYAPLSRPLFIYIARSAADRPEVASYVNFYLDNAATLSREVGFIPLPDRIYNVAKDRFARRLTGSVFEGRAHTVGMTIDELMSAEK